MRIVKVVGILSGISTLIFVVYLWQFWGVFEGRWYGGFFVTLPQITLTLVLCISGITTTLFWFKQKEKLDSLSSFKAGVSLQPAKK